MPLRALTASTGQSEHAFVALGVSHHSSNKETTLERRGLFSRLAVLPLFAGAAAAPAEETKKPLKIMFKSAWGSDDPTKAAFAFLHGNALRSEERRVGKECRTR